MWGVEVWERLQGAKVCEVAVREGEVRPVEVSKRWAVSAVAWVCRGRKRGGEGTELGSSGEEAGGGWWPRLGCEAQRRGGCWGI